MKLMILQTILDTVLNDTELKHSQKEWLLYFSNWLNWINVNRYSDNEYCTISSEYLKKLFSDNYKNLISYYKKYNWINYSTTTNNNKSYTVGSESTKYFITLPLDCNLVSYNFTSKTVCSKIEKIHSGLLKQEYKEKNKVTKEEVENELTKYYSIINEKKEIISYTTINIEKKYREILDKVTSTIPESLMEEIEEVKENLSSLKLKKQFKYIKKEIKKVEKQLTTLQQEKHKLQDFSEDNQYKAFTVDSFGLRVHTSFTRLKRKYRQNIKLNNKAMTEIDIKNAQPWLLSNLEGITDNQFKLDCARGTFYDNFITDEISREEVKTTIYRIFFGGYQSCQHAYNQDIVKKDSVLYKFINLYPTVWDFIQEVNKEDHSKLSLLLQRLETDLMIFSTWQELTEKNIDCLTIHDALFVNTENFEITMKILKENIIKKNYTMPVLKTEEIDLILK